MNELMATKTAPVTETDVDRGVDRSQLEAIGVKYQGVKR
jgi:hypothetical protein